MDTDTLHSALLSIALIANKLHSTREALGENETSAPIQEVLAHAESDLKVSKAIIAAEIGLDLCGECWPPEVLITDLGHVLRCPECNTLSVSAERKKHPSSAKIQLGLWQESVSALAPMVVQR